MTWNEPPSREQLLRKAEAGMRAGLVVLEGICKKKLAISNMGGKAPSAPGEYPHLGTGTLRSHITTAYKGIKGNKVVGALGVAAGATRIMMIDQRNGKKTRVGDYALILEVGGSRMAARPYLRPTAHDHGKEFSVAFIRAALRTK